MKKHWFITLTLATGLFTASALTGETFQWNDEEGGDFDTPGNWNPAGPPGDEDFAVFNLGEEDYGVDFTSGVANAGLRIGNDHVTFNLGGNIYELTDPTREFDLDLNSAVIGNMFAADAALTVNDGVLSGVTQVLGAVPGSHGAVTVNSDAEWISSEFLFVGGSGDGALTVNPGGTVVATRGAVIGLTSESVGTATVSGQGATWTIGGSETGDDDDGFLDIGDEGHGTLWIEDGGSVSAEAVFLALEDTDATGIVHISGSGSQITAEDEIVVGFSGHGALTLENGGSAVSNDRIWIGENQGATGTVDVIGTDSSMLALGEIVVGLAGEGTLNVTGGATVASEEVIFIADDEASSGTIRVDGPGSEISAQGVVVAGNFGDGALIISDSGRVATGEILAIGSSGVLYGDGIIAGPGILNAGLIAPGLPDDLAAGTASGRIDIEGTYLQDEGGELRIQIGNGATTGIDAGGTAELAGRLTLSFADGYEPQEGDSFEILSAESVTGTFDEVEAPESPIALEVVYEEDAVIIAFPAEPVLMTFSQWLDDNLTDEELEESVRTNPTGDPDGLGIQNILRYGFDLDPRQPNRDILPDADILENDGNEYLTITFTRRTDAGDLDYRVEASGDMEEWTTLDPLESFTMNVSPAGDGTTETVTVRDSVPINSTNARFLRVIVELSDE